MKQIMVDEQRKQSYYDKGYWSNDTLLSVFLKTVKDYGSNEYIVDDRGCRFTYKQIDELSSKLANYLINIGVKPNDVITTQIPIWSEFVIILYACVKVGAVIHPLGLSCKEAELWKNLNLTQSKVFFCPTHFRNINYEQRILVASKHISSLKNIILLDFVKPKATNNITLSTILDIYTPLQSNKFYNANADELAVILNTSGTTQGPKGVMLTHNNILFAEKMFNNVLKLTSKDIMYMPAPLHHATGFHHGLISPMLIGAKVVLQQKFDCQNAIKQMNKEKCTYSMGATPFIYDILRCMETSDLRLPFLKFYLCGGAPVPAYMVEKAKAFNISLCEVYGSTESVPHVFVSPHDKEKIIGGSCGKPMQGVEFKIVDEHNKIVKTGKVGEAVSRGPNVFIGYYKDLNTTKKVLTDDGWFYSGDLCRMDSDGNVFIVGRKKDMIVRGGENLSANEIDAYIEGLENVTDHAVIGMPDERMGEKICAFLVTKNKKEITLLDMQNFLKDKNIDKRLWPEHIEIINKIPRTASGKVKKYLLLEELTRRRKNEKSRVFS